MRKNRKAQAVLPFFGLQLASVIVFIIVIISLLMLRRNLILFTNEFNTQTENILQIRRLLSTSDCLASEEKDLYFYNESGKSMILTGSRVYPYVLDKNKLTDFQHINCMRKDFYDTPQDAESGILDIGMGTGSVSKYEIVIYELDSGSRTLYSSSVGFLEKDGIGCAMDYECSAKYGGNYTCEDGAGWWNDIPNSAGYMVIKVPLQFIALWTTPKNGYCQDTYSVDLNEEDNVPKVVKWEYKPVVYNITSYDSIYNCSERDTIREIIPVLIRDSVNTKPALAVISTCSIKGTNYNGMPFCEKSFKLKGVTGCD